jgi:uncharacterized zinc-type alcohol dehydrogenase-like protein
MPTKPRVGHRRRRPAAPPMEFERRDLRPNDVAIRSPCRHLPLRPAHLPQRLGRQPLSGVPGHEIVGTSPRSAPSHPHRSATRSRSAAWSTAAWSATSASKAGSVLPQGLRPDLQQQGPPRRHDHQGRLFRPYRRPRPFRLQGARRHGRPPRRAAAVRRHHHLLAAAPVQCRPGTKVGGRRLGGLGHMGVKLAAAMGAHVTMITTTPEKARTRASLARTT